ncbi:hypothetical protein HMPREF1012_01774 [Bacillus sp. BT1B_CT2]|nr:hypothetical protein HMPREF1012_01774 [Bacillus sp. BT1B_CT2]
MNLIIRLVKLKGCWEDLVPKMRCDASSIITNNPESGKSRRDFTAERKRYRERYGYPPIDRQCLGTKKTIIKNHGCRTVRQPFSLLSQENFVLQ